MQKNIFDNFMSATPTCETTPLLSTNTLKLLNRIQKWSQSCLALTTPSFQTLYQLTMIWEYMMTTTHLKVATDLTHNYFLHVSYT